MTDQSGERLARSACPECGSRLLSESWDGWSLECVDCGGETSRGQAYQHGLKLEREGEGAN